MTSCATASQDRASAPATLAFATRQLRAQADDDSSHTTILAWLDAMPPVRILDVGCADGPLGEQLRRLGPPRHRRRRGRGDRRERSGRRLRRGRPRPWPAAEVGDGFDVIVAADVLEHVREPDALLGDGTSGWPRAAMIVSSVPNFGHWYPRPGARRPFDYDRRGILDAGHVRFFTPTWVRPHDPRIGLVLDQLRLHRVSRSACCNPAPGGRCAGCCAAPIGRSFACARRCSGTSSSPRCTRGTSRASPTGDVPAFGHQPAPLLAQLGQRAEVAPHLRAGSSLEWPL